MMPSTESNARSLAAAKGYQLRQEPDGTITALGPDGIVHAGAVSWSALLRFLLAAPRLNHDGPEAA